MNATRILAAAMGRRKAHQINREFNKASVNGVAITAHTKRRINRLTWEGNRSPSRLGRASERAQQVHDVVAPSMLTAVAVISAAKAALELLTAYKAYKQTGEEESEEKPPQGSVEHTN